VYRGLADAAFVARLVLRRPGLDRQLVRPAPDDIDAELLSRSYDVSAHARQADAYFGSDLVGAERAARDAAHLTKPFTDAAEAVNHLSSFATLIDGLGLLPGMTVLDFGCGTGWTSRFLMQLGCRVVMCDVSSSALRIAAENLRSHPPFVPAGTPDPTFLCFDGHRIDLPDGAVDRVFCFDVFHHVPNRSEVLGELARVLSVDGVAGFHEPGPDHSRTAASQYEMRNHGFLERDVLLGEIWSEASAVGFERIRLALSAPSMQDLDMRRYDRVLRLGRVPMTFRRRMWQLASTTRVFFLSKGSPFRADSRQAEGLAGVVTVVGRRADPSDPATRRLTVQVRNSGESRWRPSDGAPGAVHLGVHRYDDHGRLVDLDHARFPIPGAGLDPGATAELEIALASPAAGGSLALDLVSEGVTWFSKRGSAVCPVELG
jgi:SAM-dependent methyltransferase